MSIGNDIDIYRYTFDRVDLLACDDRGKINLTSFNLKLKTSVKS